MKAVWKKVTDILVAIVTVAVFCLMLFTILSVTTFDQQSRSLFGYKLFVVTSDSMRATDFEAGDLIIVKKVDAGSLKPGDIISYISRHPDNYGMTITHKIRSVNHNSAGEPEFVTYGTSTGVDDDLPVSAQDVIGIYRMRIPGVGKFFAFIKTTPGYILFILLPFLIMILYYGMKAFVQFQNYRKCEMEELQKERKKIEAEKQALLQLREQEQKGDSDEHQE